jgi:hypothetical protein
VILLVFILVLTLFTPKRKEITKGEPKNLILGGEKASTILLGR